MSTRGSVGIEWLTEAERPSDTRTRHEDAWRALTLLGQALHSGQHSEACGMKAATAYSLSMFAAAVYALATAGSASAACAPNNNDPKCASFSVIEGQKHAIIDVTQRKSTSIIYLYRVCSSHGGFEIRVNVKTYPLGPGDCVDIDVSGGQRVTVVGTSELAAGQYVLLHVSD